jgi:tripartite-type tricarboxylate transporter receptor subunit TctC
MTGGGSMIAANYIYGVAKPDGLTLGVVSPAMYIEQVTGKKEVQYDWFKFSFIGSPEKTDRIFYMRADTGIKSLEEMRAVAETPRCGSTGIGSAAYCLILGGSKPSPLGDSFSTFSSRYDNVWG